MPTVTLIRHAMPHVDPATDPSTWELTDASRAQAAALTLPPGPHVFAASTEVKALDTLRQLTTQSIAADRRFCEVTRPKAPDGDTHRALAAAYLAGAGHDGWEPRASVAERFSAGIAAHLSDGAHLVVATHGMALTVWLATVSEVADPVVFWRGLAFPDVVSVALPEHWRHRRPEAI